jgi:hypothetical protein
VTPASGGVLGLGHAGSGSKSGINTNDSASEESSLLEQEMAMVNPSEIADDAISSDNDGSGGVSAGGGKVARPRTPRPPMPSMPNIKKI